MTPLSMFGQIHPEPEEGAGGKFQRRRRFAGGAQHRDFVLAINHAHFREVPTATPSAGVVCGSVVAVGPPGAASIAEM